MNQTDAKAQLSHELGQAILDAYHHGLFGKLSRPEIDAIVLQPR
jgi:hypothetical protein